MFCSRCGEAQSPEARFCSRCGARNAAPGTDQAGAYPRQRASVTLSDPDPTGAPGRGRKASLAAGLDGDLDGGPTGLRVCTTCGFRGEGVGYFRRTGNQVLLGALTLFTYAIGGLIYWGLKRDVRICPSCGTDWAKSERLSRWGSAVPTRTGATGEGLGVARVGTKLPSEGRWRRGLGLLLAVGTPWFVWTGFADAAPSALAVGALVGAAGWLSFRSGADSNLRRREAIMDWLRREVLALARIRGGRLTVTEVASSLELSLPAAERVLFSMDDGLRVRSEVTDEGVIVFEFPELSLRDA